MGTNDVGVTLDHPVDFSDGKYQELATKLSQKFVPAFEDPQILLLPAPFDQVVTKLPELKSDLVVAKTRSGNHAEPDVTGIKLGVLFENLLDRALR